ncbi:hypothetical protein ACN47E_009449 [Coniothyrium glycines]
MTTTSPDNLKERMQNSYDAIASTYNASFRRDEETISLEYLRLLISHLQSSTTSSATVLELGCGAGIPATRYMLQTESPTIHVTGNDISTTQLDFAATNLLPWKDRFAPVAGDMLSLSFPDTQFDAITGFYSIIHLPRTEQTQLLSKIANWLKPGGLFLANFAAKEFEALEEEHWLQEEKGWMFWSSWGEEGSVQMVEATGLKVQTREKRQLDGDAEFVWLLARKEGL